MVIGVFIALLAILGVATAALAWSCKTLTKQLERAERLQTDLRERNHQLELQAAVTEQKRQALEEKATQYQADLKALHEKMKLEIERSAREFLDSNTEKLSKASRDNFENLLKPFDAELKDLKRKIFETYDAESRERLSLKGELHYLLEAQKQMAFEASSLTKALKGDSKAQGDWGEVILERILESSGLKEGVDFIKQGVDLGLKNEEGQLRKPDIVINLPNQRHVIVDSKVSLKAYEAYTRFEDEASKASEMRNFLESVKTHILELSRKDYQNLYGIQSPDCVLMFMPTDGSFSLAMQGDPNLSAYGWSHKVAVVSPSLLFPTLKIVEYLWRQDKQSKNSIEIAEQAGALYDKFCLFVDDLDKIGVRLANLDEVYQDAVSKLKTGRGNLMTRFEKLKLLGAKAKKQLGLPDVAAHDEPPDLQVLGGGLSDSPELDGP